MAFDPEKHELDPDWPKWVEPHESQIVRKSSPGAPDHISTPNWPEFHVDRVSGTVSVLVSNKDEEKRALSAQEEAPVVDEPVLEQEEIEQ